MTRLEKYIKAIKSKSKNVPAPSNNFEKILYALITNSKDTPEAFNRTEQCFKKLADDGNDSVILMSLLDSSITEFSSDDVIELGQYALAGKYNLTSVNLPNLKKIGNGAFMEDIKLTSVSFPNVTEIAANAFKTCTRLSEIDLPNLEKFIGLDPFYNCSSLKKLDFPKLKTMVRGGRPFYDCLNLTTLILRSENVVPIISTTFANSTFKNGTGYIYVPSSLVEAYKADSVWSTYANQIRAIEDYPEICG